MRVSGFTRRRVLIWLATAGALGAGSTALARAVSVSPMSVFLDHRTRTGTLTLYNPNPLPEEIDISFAFGYPQSDSSGTVTVPLADTAPAGEPSAVPWLRAFPRRLVLEPGQQQVVRILAQPPADLADGEYWARVLVSATGGRPPVEQQVQPDVRVAIAMRTIVVTSLNYRKGRLSTGARVTAAAAARAQDSVRVTLDLERLGTAAYLGRIDIEVLNAAGRTIAREEDVISIYRTLRRRFAFTDVPDAARVRYTLVTERPELGQSNIIAAPAVTGVVEIR
jgi:hypothetical protein